jgi:hypothetical protein
MNGLRAAHPGTALEGRRSREEGVRGRGVGEGDGVRSAVVDVGVGFSGGAEGDGGGDGGEGFSGGAEGDGGGDGGEGGVPFLVTDSSGFGGGHIARGVGGPRAVEAEGRGGDVRGSCVFVQVLCSGS